MSILSTVLIFVLVPVGVCVVIAGFALAGSAGRRARRYRPGRPYDFDPIWFLASPGQVTSGTDGSRAHAPAIDSPVIDSPVVETGARASLGVTGGASDRW